MFVYIIRHGKAHENSDSGTDYDRTLRGKGHKQAEAIGSYLANRGDLKPELVLSSPYVRARETASSIWKTLDQSQQIDDRLGADRSLSDYLDVLIDARGAQVVAIVGHNPTCARLTSVLTKGMGAFPNHHRTGEVMCVQITGDEFIAGGELVDQYRLGD